MAVLMDHSEFRQARDRLGLSKEEAARILGTTERTITRWEASPDTKQARRPNNAAARMMRWMLGGYRPPQASEAPRKTPEEFSAGRKSLFLTQADLAVILDLDRQTVVRYELAPDLPTALSPSPFASRALDWMLGGFEPPELAEVRERKNRR